MRTNNEIENCSEFLVKFVGKIKKHHWCNIKNAHTKIKFCNNLNNEIKC